MLMGGEIGAVFPLYPKFVSLRCYLNHPLLPIRSGQPNLPGFAPAGPPLMWQNPSNTSVFPDRLGPKPYVHHESAVSSVVLSSTPKYVISAGERGDVVTAFLDPPYAMYAQAFPCFN